MELFIFFFNWNNTYSKIIEKVTKFHWTHVGIGYEDKKKGVYVIYEAINKGFVKSEYSKKTIDKMNDNSMSNCNYITLYGNITKEYFEQVANKYLGNNYDWLSIFNIALIYIFGLKSFSISSGSKQLICTEAVARILWDLKIINLSKILRKEFDIITPKEIYIKLLNKLYTQYD